MFKTAIILIAPLIFYVNSQTYPNRNCPVFQYEDQNGFTVGRVELENDFSGEYTISINMSVALYLNQNENIKIELQTDVYDIKRGFPIVYFIIFPVQNVLPKPTRIEFNGRVYCTGRPETLATSRRGITNLWASSYLGTGGSFSRPFVPEPQPFQPNWVIPEPPVTRLPYNTPILPYNTPILPYNPPILSQASFGSRSPPPTPTPAPSVMPSSQDCGIAPGVPLEMSSLPLIVGGTDLTDKQFPWMAAIMYRIKGRPIQLHDYKCTGSLVSEKHVITAGHCIGYENTFFVDKEDIIVIFGITDIEYWASSSDATFSAVSDFKVHPNFNSTNGDSDIAVFTLSKRVEFTEYVKPVCIWNEGEDLDLIVNQSGVVAGWGRDKTGNANIAKAAYVEMPVVDQVTCLRSNGKFRTITSRKTFCAGKRDGKGPCNGDSGGGFVMKRSGRWTLRGVVSRSLNDMDTCDVMNYIVFADIAKMKPWLDEVLI